MRFQDGESNSEPILPPIVSIEGNGPDELRAELFSDISEDEVDDEVNNQPTGNGSLLRHAEAKTSLLPLASMNLTYVRSKMAGLIDLGFSWSPIPVPKFFINVLLAVVSPEYSSRKHD